MGKEATEEVVVSLSHKSEDPTLPTDSSSQASMEEGNISMESNPVNISPTAATYSSCSDSPLVDLTELQTDANLATDHLLSVKRSTDLRRQGVIWELGLLLQQNKAKEAASIEKAKAAHRQGILDVKVSCAKAVLEANSNYRVAVQEAKMVRSSQL